MSITAHLDQDIKKYKAVYFGLLIFTAVTVMASRMHLGITLGILIALFIATFKASMVASFFMHLVAEKKIIYYVLIFTAFFLLAMVALFCFSHYSIPEGTKYVS